MLKYHSPTLYSPSSIASSSSNYLRNVSPSTTLTSSLYFRVKKTPEMGLLEKLWDDTVAGPQPDSGLGKLRKFKTFNSQSTPAAKDVEGGNNEEEVRVTRKIMIVKPPGYYPPSGSAPASPAGSTPPSSPFSGSRSGSFRFRRRSTSDANEKATNEDRAPSHASPQDI